MFWKNHKLFVFTNLGFTKNLKNNKFVDKSFTLFFETLKKRRKRKLISRDKRKSLFHHLTFVILISN